MVNVAVFVAIAASMGNMLQGWDNANIAGHSFINQNRFDLPISTVILSI